MYKGLSGIITDLVTQQEIAARPPDAEQNEKLTLFRAMKMEVEAVIALAHRYADLAQELSRRPKARQGAQNCDKSPRSAATYRNIAATFHEAVQSFWMIHYALFPRVRIFRAGASISS